MKGLLHGRSPCVLTPFDAFRGSKARVNVTACRFRINNAS